MLLSQLSQGLTQGEQAGMWLLISSHVSTWIGIVGKWIYDGRMEKHKREAEEDKQRALDNIVRNGTEQVAHAADTNMYLKSQEGIRNNQHDANIREMTLMRKSIEDSCKAHYFECQLKTNNKK